MVPIGKYENACLYGFMHKNLLVEKILMEIVCIK